MKPVENLIKKRIPGQNLICRPITVVVFENRQQGIGGLLLSRYMLNFIRGQIQNNQAAVVCGW